MLFLVLILFSVVSVQAEFEVKRFPSKYYDWGFSSGRLDSRYLNPSLTTTQLKKVLAPHGSFKKEGDSILFTFEDGGNIKISTDGEKVLFLNFLYGNYRQENSVKSKFKSVLSTDTKREAFYRPNPYYRQELSIRNILISEHQKTPSAFLNLCDVFDLNPGVNFVQDSHGEQSRYDFIKDTLENKSVDWFGIEMLPHNLQKEINDFINQSESSVKYVQARLKLEEHFTHYWNEKFQGSNLTGKNNPYFKLLVAARERKVQVYAMDVESNYYMTNNFRDPMVHGTRNQVWSDQLPTSGKGLVFGGSSHFDKPLKATVQGLYHRKASSQQITIITAKEKCNLNENQKKVCKQNLEHFRKDKRCESLSNFRCLRKNTGFVSPACATALGVVPLSSESIDAQESKGIR